MPAIWWSEIVIVFVCRIYSSVQERRVEIALDCEKRVRSKRRLYILRDLEEIYAIDFLKRCIWINYRGALEAECNEAAEWSAHPKITVNTSTCIAKYTFWEISSRSTHLGFTNVEGKRSARNHNNFRDPREFSQDPREILGDPRSFFEIREEFAYYFLKTKLHSFWTSREAQNYHLSSQNCQNFPKQRIVVVTFSGTPSNYFWNWEATLCRSFNSNV